MSIITKFPKTSKVHLIDIVLSLAPSIINNKLGCYSVQLYVILKLCVEFQFPAMPITGQKVCGGGVVVWWWWWLKPILVFSLAQAEQYRFKKT